MIEVDTEGHDRSRQRVRDDGHSMGRLDLYSIYNIMLSYSFIVPLTSRARSRSKCSSRRENKNQSRLRPRASIPRRRGSLREDADGFERLEHVPSVHRVERLRAVRAA